MKYIQATPFIRHLKNGKYLCSVGSSCCLPHAICREYDGLEAYWQRTIAPYRAGHLRSVNRDKLLAKSTAILKRINRLETVFCEFFEKPLPPCECGSDERLLEYPAGLQLLEELKPTITPEMITTFSL